MGKTLSQDSIDSPSIAYLEHYVKVNIPQPTWDTSHRQNLILVHCTVCVLNSFYPPDFRPNCVIAIPTKRTCIFKVYKSNNAFEYKKYKTHFKKNHYFVACKSWLV